MNRNWLYFTPADQPTAAMLEFILSSCQEVRRMADRYRFPVPDEDKQGLVSEFIKTHPEAKPVPRYTLLIAVNWPSSQVNGFMLAPRPGWSSAEKKIKDSLSWEQYQRGESATRKSDIRVVDATVAYDQFLLNRKLHFKWGTIVMQSGVIAKLGRQAGDYSGSLLSHIEWMEVRVVRTENGERRWKMAFQLNSQK